MSTASRLNDPLDPETIASLRALIVRLGEARALAAIGVSRASLTRGLAGLGVHRGTALWIRAALAEAEDALAAGPRLAVVPAAISSVGPAMALGGAPSRGGTKGPTF